MFVEEVGAYSKKKTLIDFLNGLELTLMLGQNFLLPDLTEIIASYAVEFTLIGNGHSFISHLFTDDYDSGFSAKDNCRRYDSCISFVFQILHLGGSHLLNDLFRDFLQRPNAAKKIVENMTSNLRMLVLACVYGLSLPTELIRAVPDPDVRRFLSSGDHSKFFSRCKILYEEEYVTESQRVRRIDVIFKRVLFCSQALLGK